MVMDTRTPSPVQRTESNGDGHAEAVGEGGAVVENGYKPDLSAEVAMLSTKLVNAINYQTNLDDSLQQTRHELEQARTELAKIRAEKREVDGQIVRGELVRRSYVDKEINRHKQEAAESAAARDAAEKAKKQTEGELENLTTALFEEANGMVAAARKDTEAVERRNSQLRTQLNDTELLLASQTEQLQDLKGVMERLEERQSEHDGGASVPVTPVDAHKAAAWDALQLSPHAANALDVPPDHPLHFGHLLLPIMRHDIAAYTDFQELLASARRAMPHSRQGSGNIASSSTPNLSDLNKSTPSLPGAFSFGGGSANNSPSSSNYPFNNPSQQPALKDSKFYKRALLEDIEPTLRLELAPGLSFLSRRSVLSSLLSGSLVVEPFNALTKTYGLGAVFSCALCGEARKNEPYVRKYRFRTSESEDAQRYPLCDWCLTRIRAAGDFVGFLRMVRDGHWRCESDEEVKGAWEEATRLRERMFWARLGGGVVPASQVMRREVAADSPESVGAIKSARPSLESIPEREAKDHAVAAGSSVTERSAPSEVADSPAQADGSLERPPPPGRERSASAIARAIMGTSSGVLATGRPDAAPATPPQSSGHGAADSAAANAQLEAEADATLRPFADETPEDERATTPFEDAPTESQQDQSDADAQLQQEAAQGVPTIEEPAPQQPAEVAMEKPALAERRPSAVQERIRAMEAKAKGLSLNGGGEKKLPGAFD